MKKIFKMAIIGGAITALVGCGVTMLKTYEEPDYTITSRASEKPIIETRTYIAKLIAEVEVSGEREKAIGDGFRLLADFIFGNNTANGPIDMTTPVAQQATSAKINMTTPVAQQALGDNTWHVRFYMPKEYTKDNLPQPNNDQVTIRELPGYEAIAIRFSGRTTEANLAEYKEKLDAHIATHNLNTDGEATYAFFDPPWTPWFLKRNEIIYKLR